MLKLSKIIYMWGVGMGMKIETKNRCIKLVERYINNDKIFDFIRYAVANDVSVLRNIDSWVDFVKNNCSKEMYNKFMAKAMPFVNEDGSENEELKNRVRSMAYRIFTKNAGLFDVVKEITPSMNQFAYMMKQLRFYYKITPSYLYDETVKFCARTGAYDNPKAVFNYDIANLSEASNKKIIEFVKSIGMLLNNITYYEAYKYLSRKGEIGTLKDSFIKR